MKTFLMVITFFSSAVTAQQTSVSKSVKDDGETISITVTGNINGKKIDYSNKFNSRNINSNKREKLIKHIFDSLGVSDTTISVGATQTTIQSSDELKNDAPQLTAQNGNSTSYVVGGKHPYTKEIKYDASAGILFMRYRFMKDGTDNIYERTISANNASKEQRNDIIQQFEKDIALTSLK